MVLNHQVRQNGICPRFPWYVCSVADNMANGSDLSTLYCADAGDAISGGSKSRTMAAITDSLLPILDLASITIVYKLLRFVDVSAPLDAMHFKPDRFSCLFYSSDLNRERRTAICTFLVGNKLRCLWRWVGHPPGRPLTQAYYLAFPAILNFLCLSVSTPVTRCTSPPPPSSGRSALLPSCILCRSMEFFYMLFVCFF